MWICSEARVWFGFGRCCRGKKLLSILLGPVLGDLQIKLQGASPPPPPRIKLPGAILAREKSFNHIHTWDFTEKCDSKDLKLICSPSRGKGGERSPSWKTNDFLER